jgi:hypothetical protein
MFKVGDIHRPTSILGPGKFVATDIDIPLGCSGPVAMLRFHCIMGHAWGMTMREDGHKVFCVLHKFPDWEHEPTPEQMQKLVKDITTMDENTQLKHIETAVNKELKKTFKKKKES